MCEHGQTRTDTDKHGLARADMGAVDGVSAMLNVQAGDCQQEVVKSFAGF